MKVAAFSELPSFIEQSDFKINGCFADTSILFAATYPLDNHNADAEDVFQTLSKKGISVFTNVNVKHEFLEFHRRVILADSLCDFYDLFGDTLPTLVEAQLKSFKTSHRKKVDTDKSSKLELEQQKKFIYLLRPIEVAGKDGWDLLCKTFLLPQLTPIWKDTSKKLGIVEIKVREDDESAFLNSKPDWDDVVKLMGTYAIGSSDAMIINIFNCSKIPILLTADFEMARCVLSEKADNKFVFVPDNMYIALRP